MSGACDNTLIHNVHAVFKKKNCLSIGQWEKIMVLKLSKMFFGTGREREKNNGTWPFK
jgi:hypothetical protein